MSPRKKTTPNSSGAVRILAGQLKHRKLTVIDAPGLRPTGNRIRETLFNWLAADLTDSVCVDLFSGSGALAFEAASRYAQQVYAVELAPNSASVLQRQQRDWQCRNLAVVQSRAEDWLTRYTGTIDIAFLDPPFNHGLHTPLLTQLSQHPGLHRDSQIYVEAGKQEVFDLPDNWTWRRHKIAGDVQFGILTNSDTNA